MKFLNLSILALLLHSVGFATWSVDKETALYAEYALLLDKYATDTGVKYAQWAKSKEDLKILDSILENWATVDLSRLSTGQQKAFYINLYNAAMIQAVFQSYPIKSVTEILPDFGIFKKKFIKQGTRSLSLDDVEKGILLKEYPDGRIHFAVNCASRSCPPLRGEPFISSNLDAQMDEQTQLYFDSEWGVQVVSKKEIHISALFDWYRSDFPKGNLLSYINKYRSASKLPTSAKIKFLNYDWALNTPL